MRPRGRPRSIGVDDAILTAALNLLAERGYRGMTIPAVARAAGVTSPTVYLRYPSKYELAVAAIARLQVLTEPPNTGSARTDLVLAVEAVHATMQRVSLSILGLALSEEAEHPEFLDRIRAQLSQPFVSLLREVLARGVERGEIRADADVDAVAHLLHGAPVGRYLTPGLWRRDWSQRVVAAVWPALEAKPQAPVTTPPRRRTPSTREAR